jgi:DNA-binding protein
MSYVMAVIRTFNMFNANSVVLRARGRAISTAVDVAEIARQRFISDIHLAKIEIGTEDLPTREGGTRGVSTIAITLEKKPETVSEEGSKPPSVDVLEVKGVGGARAEKLKEAGYPTVSSLAEAVPAELSHKVGISENLSAKLIESAKELLKQG